MATRNTHVGKDRLSKSNSSTNADRVTDKKKTHLRTQVSGVRDRALACAVEWRRSLAHVGVVACVRVRVCVYVCVYVLSHALFP